MDSTLLDMFSFDFIYGNEKTALNGPNKLMLSESMAKRLFGDVDPIGQLVTTTLIHVIPEVDPNYTFVVSGVFKDLPKNSHLEMEALISSTSDPELANYYFGRFTFLTYVLLKDGIEPAELEGKISDIYNYIDKEREPVMKFAQHELVPITAIHMAETGGRSYLYIFGVVGLLMLLIAIISYVNLVTAQASKRALEIGVRKVMGSDRRQLIVQFLTESMGFSFLALVLALGIVFFSLSPLNGILNLQLESSQLFQSNLIWGMVAILFVVGLLGGSYPAFFLSAFEPITVLKGRIAKGTGVRRALVATQFAVVLFVLVSTGMIYNQLQYMRNKDLGFNKDQVVHIDLTAENALAKIPVLKEKLLSSALIDGVATAGFLPGVWMGTRPLSADNGASQESQFVHYGMVDHDYLQTMEIKLLAGRNYDIERSNEATQNIIINESLAKNFGLENPIGERVRYGDSANPNYLSIIGVVEDFHQNTLHTEIGSQIFILNPANPHLAVRLNGNLREGITNIENTWREIFPNEELAYRFLDEDLAEAYETDQIRGQLFLLFSVVTFIIAFLGLFGLVAFIARQKVKEIGVRRVLGASTWNVVRLLSKDFLLLILFAAIPAFLGAWYFINNWLEDFAYRTEMNYLLFGMVLFFTLFFTFLTTSLHAIKTTRLNPAEVLKE